MDSVVRSLFELDMPWWEFVLRATAVYVVVLVMVRLSGKRTVGQFTPFDLLVVVLLPSIKKKREEAFVED